MWHAHLAPWFPQNERFWQFSNLFHHFEVGLKMFQQHYVLCISLGDHMSPAWTGPNHLKWHHLMSLQNSPNIQVANLEWYLYWDSSTPEKGLAQISVAWHPRKTWSITWSTMVIVELWHWQESQHISSHFYIYFTFDENLRQFIHCHHPLRPL